MLGMNNVRNQEILSQQWQGAKIKEITW